MMKQNNDIFDGLGSIRTEKAPKKTIVVYKLMRLNGDKLYPLFIDRSEPVKIGVWYNADAPDFDTLKKLDANFYYLMDGKNVVEKRSKSPSKSDVDAVTKKGYRYIFIEETTKLQRRFGENRKYWNVGITGSNAVGLFSMRAGWHAGSLPTMRQIGKGKNKDLRDDRFVWTECEISADIDYNTEAQQNPDKDLPTKMPENGYYLKATNADKVKSQADKVGWYVAGAIKINRIISDKEARSIIDKFNKRTGLNVLYDFQRESGKDFDPERGLVGIENNLLGIDYKHLSLDELKELYLGEWHNSIDDLQEVYKFAPERKAKTFLLDFLKKETSENEFKKLQKQTIPEIVKFIKDEFDKFDIGEFFKICIPTKLKEWFVKFYFPKRYDSKIKDTTLQKLELQLLVEESPLKITIETFANIVKQYNSLKQNPKYKDVILIFTDSKFQGRMAQLHICEKDAEIAGKILKRKPTKFGLSANRFYLEEYLSKLIRAGYRVAIVEEKKGLKGVDNWNVNLIDGMNTENINEVLSGLGTLVYHNSPYLLKKADGSFIDPITKEKLGFDHRFMSKGEGAQVHGWGSYFSVEDLRKYAENLPAAVYYDGNLLKDKISELAYHALAANNLNIDNAIYSLNRKIETIKKSSSISEEAKKSFLKKYEDIIPELEHLDQSKITKDNNNHNYVVEIPDNDGFNYLEEYKPIKTKQLAKIVSYLNKKDKKTGDYFKTLKGTLCSNIYNELTLVYKTKEMASKFLKKCGIVGIHYFGKTDGECYVIFDENDAKIVKHELFGLGSLISEPTKQTFYENLYKQLESIVKDDTFEKNGIRKFILSHIPEDYKNDDIEGIVEVFYQRLRALKCGGKGLGTIKVPYIDEKQLITINRALDNYLFAEYVDFNEVWYEHNFIRIVGKTKFTTYDGREYYCFGISFDAKGLDKKTTKRYINGITFIINYLLNVEFPKSYYACTQITDTLYSLCSLVISKELGLPYFTKLLSEYIYAVISYFGEKEFDVLNINIEKGIKKQELIELGDRTRTKNEIPFADKDKLQKAVSPLLIEELKLMQIKSNVLSGYNDRVIQQFYYDHDTEDDMHENGSSRTATQAILKDLKKFAKKLKNDLGLEDYFYKGKNHTIEKNWRDCGIHLVVPQADTPNNHLHIKFYVNHGLRGVNYDYEIEPRFSISLGTEHAFDDTIHCSIWDSYDEILRDMRIRYLCFRKNVKKAISKLLKTEIELLKTDTLTNSSNPRFKKGDLVIITINEEPEIVKEIEEYIYAKKGTLGEVKGVIRQDIPMFCKKKEWIYSIDTFKTSGTRFIEVPECYLKSITKKNW